MSRLAAVLGLVVLCSGCPATRADIAMSEQIIQLGDAVNDLRQMNAELQEQIDSLRVATAKQDTVVRQLANLAGVSYQR